MKTAYLLSGKPGTGKTTMIKDILSRIGKSSEGFYTEEIRSEGSRLGFRVVTLDGKNSVLAHIDIHSLYSVSKYRVDVEGFDKIAVPSLRQAIQSKDIVVIDEIGKMELFSASFKDAVIVALESGKKVLGTIMLASHPWADKIKERPEVEIVKITRPNRDEATQRILDWVTI